MKMIKTTFTTYIKGKSGLKEGFEIAAYKLENTGLYLHKRIIVVDGVSILTRKMDWCISATCGFRVILFRNKIRQDILKLIQPLFKKKWDRINETWSKKRREPYYNLVKQVWGEKK